MLVCNMLVFFLNSEISVAVMFCIEKHFQLFMLSKSRGSADKNYIFFRQWSGFDY